MLWLRRFPLGSVDAVITDPPYGIAYESRTGATVANDDGPFIWWMRAARDAMRDGAPIVCFCRWDVEEAFRLALTWAGFTIRNRMIWVKPVGSAGGDCARSLNPSHETAWLATKENWRLPGNRERDVFEIKGVFHAHRLHPTEKPVELLRRIITTVTSPGDLVLDPFAGSGSTGEACLREGRAFRGCELDAAHVSNARARLRRVASGGAARLRPHSDQSAPPPSTAP